MKWIIVLVVMIVSKGGAQSLIPYLGTYSGMIVAEITQTSDGFRVAGKLPKGEAFQRQFCAETPVRFKESTNEDPFRDRMLSWAVIHPKELRVYDLYFSPKGDSHLRKLIFNSDHTSAHSVMIHDHPPLKAGTQLYESLKPFFGTYEGDALSSMNTNERHLKLSFLPFNDGFKLMWETEIKTASEQAPFHLRKASFTFLPSTLSGLYREDMRVSIFEKARRLHFTKGDPFVWAILHDHTMTVFHLVLNENHDYSLQIYRRTLSEDGNALTIQFTSYIDGQKGDDVKGTLQRKK